MNVTLYILWSPSRQRYYSGISNNLTRRLTQHLSGDTRVTADASDWRVTWSTVVADHAAACQMEKSIKGRGAQRFLLDQGCAGPARSGA